MELVTCLFLFVELAACWFLFKHLLHIDFFSSWSLSINFSPHETDFVHGNFCVLNFVHGNRCVLCFVRGTCCSLIFGHVDFSLRENSTLIFLLLKMIFSWTLLSFDLFLLVELNAFWILFVALVACWFFTSGHLHVDFFFCKWNWFYSKNLSSADFCSWNLLRANFCYWNLYIEFLPS